MKQIILTVFICFAFVTAQAQVRGPVSSQSEAKGKPQLVEQQDKEVSIYPNPNNGIFTISFNNLNAQQVDLRIINVIGNEIYHEVLSYADLQSTKTIDLNRFAKGLYYVKVETDNYSSVRRVVVK
ncbi:T9SS type A sorting domain-containing protein [Pontibacter roseus]|uniref:T9SS type A sorting domain-containing protein n=1 Tax=Pontibacter roseus TaxID=336989 RepID=UPI00037E6CB7|nr:T9SS type A sorting domain-containing protein [Pontibacter roseus]